MQLLGFTRKLLYHHPHKLNVSKVGCEETSVTKIGLRVNVNMTKTDVYWQSNSGHRHLFTAKLWSLTFTATKILTLLTSLWLHLG